MEYAQQYINKVYYRNICSFSQTSIGTLLTLSNLKEDGVKSGLIQNT